MRLSLGEISRERDALRSHVRLLHQQLADSAISTALAQRKPARPASGAIRGGGSGGVASGAKPRLGKEEVKKLNERLHFPPERVNKEERLKWLEKKFKEQSRELNSDRVNKRLEKKFESKEALEASVRAMYYSAMDKRKRLDEKNDAERKQAYVRKGSSMSREEVQRSATRLHTNGVKIPRPRTRAPEPAPEPEPAPAPEPEPAPAPEP